MPVEIAKRIELNFGIKASFDLSYTVLRKFSYLQKFRYFCSELRSSLSK